MSTATMRGAMNAIYAAASEEQAIACLKYLELLNIDRTFRDILRFGVEGVHFNYITNEQGVQVAQRTEQGINNWSMDGFVTGSVKNASCSSDSYYDWDEIYEGYKDARVSTLGAFTFDTDPVSIDCAACSAVMGKYTNGMLTGTIDIDEKLPEIQKELEEAGIYNVMNEAQRQLDEYLASGE